MQEKLLQQVLEAEQRAANIQPTTDIESSHPGMVHNPQGYDNYPAINSSQGHNANVRTSIPCPIQEPQTPVLKQMTQSNDSHLPNHNTNPHHFVSSNTSIDNGLDRTSAYNMNNQNNPTMSGTKHEQSLTLPQLQQTHHQQQFWTANHIFLTQANYHAENPRVPSPMNLTYLTPSRTGPVVAPFQTPTLVRNRPIRAKRRTPTSDGDTDKSCDEDEIDVVNDPRSRTLDSGKDSDVSMLSVQSGKSTSPSGSSTKSTSPTGSAKSSSPTGSTKSCSPTGSSADGSPILVTSPQNEPVRKKARTNYSPSQVQALEKVFHENPYPDSEKMESLSQELDIPEGKIKVWFQNKRARWRRRAQDNSHMTPFYAHMSPMMSPMAPYGFMNGMFCAPPSPAQVVPNTLMYPSTPTTASSTSNSTNSPQSPTMTSPYQSRGHMPTPYFPMYPYGMFPPYYCS